MPKILIIRFSSIGDIVLTTPVVRCLKAQMPDAEIHYLVKSKHVGLIRNNPNVAKVHAFDSNLRKVAQKLKSNKFDFVIDLHNNLRSRYITTMLGCKTIHFDKLNLRKWLLTRLHIKMMPSKHLVDRYMETLESFGIRNDGKGLDFFIREKDEVRISSLPENFQNGYYAFVIGGSFFTKKLPNDKIVNVINKSKRPVILIGDESDQGNGCEIARKVNAPILNQCGKYSIGQSASILLQADGIITNDTGMMHIAAALKKPLVSVWGNTVPAFGMTPYYGDEKVTHPIVQVHGLSCRPCSKLGHSKCPKGHFECMEMMPSDEIVKRLSEISLLA